MTEAALFELVDQANVDDDSWVVLRADDSAPACCRYCQTASTAAGIVRLEHGPTSTTCERMRVLVRTEEATS